MKEFPEKRGVFKKRDDSSSDEVLNSEEFSHDKRPDLFSDDRLFNRLPFEKAAQICWDHEQIQKKKEIKAKEKNSVEKADDKLPAVQVPEGIDDSVDKLHKVARSLRPVNKEVKDMMSWLPTKWEDIIRNLPLDVFGLADAVSPEVAERCHDLASTIKIKMFSPNHLRSSTTKSRQSAVQDSEGKLVLETEDQYGELSNCYDVLLAINTLCSVWQKLHPNWPAGLILQRVCVTMKLFSHCDKALTIMVDFVDRFLATNASR